MKCGALFKNFERCFLHLRSRKSQNMAMVITWHTHLDAF
jgi:hypothetical protein